MIKITGSVGKAGANRAGDVRIVQRLLRGASRYMVSYAPQMWDLDCVRGGWSRSPYGRMPMAPTATMAPTVQETGTMDDVTLEAIELFQSKVVKMDSPDGRVDAGGRTFGKLANPGSGPFFPFPSVPTLDWTTEPRSYGARRSGGARAHAGCDLYFPVGTWMYAVADGTVVANPRAFYRGTDQISIYHPSLGKTLRYGEIKRGSAGSLRQGSTVLGGTRLARVGKMTGLQISMLHLEAYSGRVLPRLDTSNAAKKLSVRGTMVSTKRLSSLTDPTPLLNSWKSNLPRAYS